MNHSRVLLSLSLAVFTLGASAQAVPTTINYQGRLTDNTPAQTPVSAAVPMQFAIFDAASAGTRLWQEPAVDNTGTSIVVNGGIFNYVLGNTVAIAPAVFSGATSVRYLQITLNPGTPGAEILTPRQHLTSQGYANLAANANNAVSANNATTVTNGVYTTGSYANPAWITSLALTGAISASNLSGSNTGNVTLGAVGAAPNGNGATITGQALTLQPADGSNPGVLTTGTQTIAGNKNFTGNITAANIAPSFGLIFTAGSVNPNNLTPYWTGLNGDAPAVGNAPSFGPPMPVNCTFNALYLRLDTVTTGANTITVTLYKNGVAQSLTASAANPGVVGGSILVSDTTHTVPVVIGDAMSIGFSQTNNVPITRIGVSTRCQ